MQKKEWEWMNDGECCYDYDQMRYRNYIRISRWNGILHISKFTISSNIV